MKEEIKNRYFIERVAEEDWIGFDSYVISLIDAINSGAKFIGLIGDYGSGKSTLINKLKQSKEKSYNVINVNLWHCGALSEDENNNIDIHRIFLHQLIDKIKINNKEYYKKKINKNYSFFDMLIKRNYYIYVFVLLVFYVISFLDKLGFYYLFVPDSFWYYIWYTMISIYTIAIIFVLKPIFSFNKSNIPRSIDENDTKDLYNEIIDDYFKIEDNKNKKLVISLEELDRYDSLDAVLKYLKEFYKFYRNPNIQINKKHDDGQSDNKKCDKRDNVVFIISLKSVNQLCGKSKKNSINETKKIYEKIFDFILNLKQVNIQDYDGILKSLVNSGEIRIPNGIELTTENIDKWRYLYKGNNIKIRDMKHRYNFAIATYYSVVDSELDNPDFYKCLYLSYLEDEYNELYELLINNNLIGDMLISYANNNDISDFMSNIFENNISEIFEDNISETTKSKYEKVLLEGLDNKYISFDYNYYFYKLPKNIKPFNISEYVLYNVIFYEDDDKNLNNALNNLSDNQICNILSKRTNTNFIPLVIFKYPRLFSIVFEREHEAYFNTITKRINLIINFESFKDFVLNAKNIKKHYLKILSEYFKFYLPKILELDDEEKLYLLRKNITVELGKDVIVVKELFLNSNILMTFDEMKNIDDIKTIMALTNLSIINENYINALIKYLSNKKISKEKIIDIIKKLSKNDNVSSESFEKFMSSVRLNEYKFSEKECIQIFNISKDKLNLNNVDNFNRFLNCIVCYCEKYDNHYLSILRNSDFNITVEKYTRILDKMGKIYKEGMEFLSSHNLIFPFSKKIREEFYKEKYYKYYIMSTAVSEKIYEIEDNKKDILKNYYLQIFEDKEDWNYKVGPNMTEFLYSNVNMDMLNADKLITFVLCPQHKDIIKAVLNTNDSAFINKYLSKIKTITHGDKLNIFKMLGHYIRNNGKLNESARKNLKCLAGKSKKALLYLDGRKKMPEYNN